ncbi:MAG: hypothetical protein ACTSXL_01790 [Alphaproteobacteria bacterium]
MAGKIEKSGKVPKAKTAEELKLDKLKASLKATKEKAELREDVGEPAGMIVAKKMKQLEIDMDELDIPEEKRKIIRAKVKKAIEGPIEKLALGYDIEKTPEFRDLDKFVNDIENYPVLKKIIESKNPKKSISGFFKKIAKKFGASAAAVGLLLLNWAKTNKKDSPIWSNVAEKIAGWFGAEVPKEKIADLKKETKKLMKEKKWDEAETKANEILEIDPENKFAKRMLENIEKKKAKGETAETAEFKYKKEFGNLKYALSLSAIPFVELKKEDYEAVLKEKGNDPKKLETALQKSMKKPNGPLALIYKEVMVIRSLNKGKFKFKLSDISLTPDQAKDIADALDKKDDRRLELASENRTPEKFREFVEAVKKGNTAEYIKKQKPPETVAAPTIFGIPMKPPKKKS